MVENLTKEQVFNLVYDVRGDFYVILKFIEKYGKHAISFISHGQLHLDFDNRYNSPMNNDILWLFPMEESVALTSYKGSIYGHCLDCETIDFTEKGTGEILTDMIMCYGDEEKIRKMMLKYKIL